jgi:hypothetical protein
MGNNNNRTPQQIFPKLMELSPATLKNPIWTNPSCGVLEEVGRNRLISQVLTFRIAKSTGMMLTSFAFVPLKGDSCGKVIHMVAINSQSQIENVIVHDPLMPSWAPENNLIVLNARFGSTYEETPTLPFCMSPIQLPLGNLSIRSQAEPEDPAKSKSLYVRKDNPHDSLRRSLSLHDKSDSSQVNHTSRKPSDDRPQLTRGISGAKLQFAPPSSRLFVNNPMEMFSFKDDIAFIMKNRAILGYSMNVNPLNKYYFCCLT